jgi:hypothetical protein
MDAFFFGARSGLGAPDVCARSYQIDSDLWLVIMMEWRVGSRAGDTVPRLILSNAQKSAGDCSPCSAGEGAGLRWELCAKG